MSLSGKVLKAALDFLNLILVSHIVSTKWGTLCNVSFERYNKYGCRHFRDLLCAVIHSTNYETQHLRDSALTATFRPSQSPVSSRS